MKVKEEYDVLKLIEHGQICYVSSEYIKGTTLYQWLKFHPCIKKEELFEIIRQITQQLCMIHKCRGNTCYKYVNPYSIIVSENRVVYFLDTNAESAAGLLRVMQRRNVREHFLPPEELYYQRASVELDIYGLGKTLQFIFSQTEAEPVLSRREEVRFQKIISRCLNRHSKKTYQDISEIQKSIPKLKNIKETSAKPRRLRKIIAAGCMLAVMVVTVSTINNTVDIKQENLISTQKAAEKEEVRTIENNSTESLSENTYLNMELGMLYFLKLKNYEKSKEYFERDEENELAQDLTVVVDYLSGGDTKDYEMREALEKAEQALELENQERIGERTDFYQCFLRGYSFLETEEDAKNVLRIGAICLEDGRLEEKSEVLGCMAAACEDLGNIQEAIEMYTEQMKYEEREANREEIYKKSADLLTESGQIEKAQEMLRKGIEEFKESLDLRISYIRIILKDSRIERPICMQNIEEQLKEMPGIREQEEFQKLMKEYGLQVEGEKVW